MRTCTVLALSFLIVLACTSLAFADGRNLINESQQIVSAIAEGPSALTVILPAIVSNEMTISEDLLQPVTCQSIQMSDCTGYDSNDPTPYTVVAKGLFSRMMIVNALFGYGDNTGDPTLVTV